MEQDNQLIIEMQRDGAGSSSSSLIQKEDVHHKPILGITLSYFFHFIFSFSHFIITTQKSNLLLLLCPKANPLTTLLRLLLILLSLLIIIMKKMELRRKRHLKSSVMNWRPSSKRNLSKDCLMLR